MHEKIRNFSFKLQGLSSKTRIIIETLFVIGLVILTPRACTEVQTKIEYQKTLENKK